MSKTNARRQVLRRLGNVLGVGIATLLFVHLVARVAWALSPDKAETFDARTGIMTSTEKTFWNYGSGRSLWALFADHALMFLLFLAVMIFLMEAIKGAVKIVEYVLYGPEITRNIRPAPDCDSVAPTSE